MTGVSVKRGTGPGVLNAAEPPKYEVIKQYKVINAPWTFKLPRERSSGCGREERPVRAGFRVAWWPGLGLLTQRPDGRWFLNVGDALTCLRTSEL